jgi:hypothetical protein
MDAAADPKRRLSYDAQQAALLGEMRDDAAVCAAVWAMVLQALRVSVPPTHALHHVHYVQHAAGQWTSVIERMRGGLSASGISRHTLQAERVVDHDDSSQDKEAGRRFLPELLASFETSTVGVLAAGASSELLVTLAAGFLPISSDSELGLAVLATAREAAAAAAGTSCTGSADRGACRCNECLAACELDLRMIEAIESSPTDDWVVVAAKLGAGKTPDACRLWWQHLCSQLEQKSRDSVENDGHTIPTLHAGYDLPIRGHDPLLRMQNTYLRQRLERTQSAEELIVLDGLRAKRASMLAAREQEARRTGKSGEAELARLRAQQEVEMAALSNYVDRMRAETPEESGLVREAEMHRSLVQQLIERKQDLTTAHEAAAAALVQEQRVFMQEEANTPRNRGATKRMNELDSDITGLVTTLATLRQKWLGATTLAAQSSPADDCSHADLSNGRTIAPDSPGRQNAPDVQAVHDRMAAGNQEEAAREEEPPAAVDMFYAAMDGEQAQASTADVAGLLASGAMTAETQVWTEGLEDWMPLREATEKVPGLASVFIGGE